MSQIDLDLSYYYKAFENKSKAVKSVVETAKSYGMEHSEYLAGDIFNALYQKDPKLVSVEDPDNKYAQAIRGVLKSGQFLKLRGQTANSLSWSAIGASILVDSLAKTGMFQQEQKPEEKTKPPEPEECENPQPSDGGDGEDKIGKSQDNKSEPEDKPEDKGEDKDNEDDSSEGTPKGEEEQKENGDEPGGSEDSESDEGKPEDNGTDSENSDGSEKGDDSEDSDDEPDGDGEQDDTDYSELDEQKGEPVDIQIQRAVNEAGEKLDDIMKGLSPGSGDSVETFTDSADLAELYTDLATNPSLSELIQLVGKLRLNTNFLPAMTVGEPEEISEVNLGNELEKTLPFDIGLMMGNDEEFFHFYTKLENAELTQYETVTHKQPGAGPIIVCVDYSGSMTYQLAGSDKTREQWAKSLAMAIYIQALKENRPYAIIPFADWAAIHRPKQNGKLDVEFMKEMVSVYVGGGTEFQPPWDMAIKFITESREGADFRDADLVYITDGMGSFDYNKVAKDKEDNNIRLVTIFLGGTKRRGAVGSWSELSDAMCFVDKLSPNAEAEAFKIIKNKDLVGMRDL